MTEHESRKCNERRSGFCFVTFNKHKGSPVENGIVKKKSFSHMSSLKVYNDMCFSENKFLLLKFQRNNLLPKIST